MQALIAYREDQFELAQTRIEDGLAQIANLPEGSRRASLETTLKNLKAALQKHQAGEHDDEDPFV